MRLAALPPLLFALSGVTTLWAEEPPPPSSPFGEQVEVEVVNVDTIVTDREGRPVTDLGRDDFVLRIDGQPVSIEYFAAPRSRTAPPPAASTRPLAPPPGQLLAVTAPRKNLVIYVDQSALEVHDSSRMVDEIREFVTSRLDGSTEVAVAAFTDSLQILTGQTTSAQQIEGALDAVAKLRGRGSFIKAERFRIQTNLQRLRGERGEDSSSIDLRQFAESELDRQSRSVAALQHWVSALSGLEGRKAVLLATAGISASRLGYLEAAWAAKEGAHFLPPYKASLDAAQRALASNFEAMLDSAQNARVAFYTIAPRIQTDFLASAEIGSLDPEANALPPRDWEAINAASSVLRMATATGGRTFLLDDQLSDRLAQVTDDEAAAYSLGFSAGSADDEKAHSIEVTTTREGLTVRHREGYRQRSFTDRVDEALGAATALQAVNNPLQISLELGTPVAAKNRAKTSTVPLLVKIPLRDLALVQRDGALHGSLSARAETQDDRGKIFSGQSEPIAVVVPVAARDRVATDYWSYRAELLLAPGNHRVAVIIADEVGGSLATAVATIEIPKG